METNSGQEAPLLSDLRRQRAELRYTMSAVEHALASPAPVRGTHWAAWLRVTLVELYDDFEEHVALTEGPEGLYSEVARTAPRLMGPVEHLSREHVEIGRQIEVLITWVDATDDLPDVAEARRIGTNLLVALMRHRQRGADLVFQAFEVDIGGET